MEFKRGHAQITCASISKCFFNAMKKNYFTW